MISRLTLAHLVSWDAFGLDSDPRERAKMTRTCFSYLRSSESWKVAARDAAGHLRADYTAEAHYLPNGTYFPTQPSVGLTSSRVFHPSKSCCPARECPSARDREQRMMCHTELHGLQGPDCSPKFPS